MIETVLTLGIVAAAALHLLWRVRGWAEAGRPETGRLEKGGCCDRAAGCPAAQATERTLTRIREAANPR